VSLIYVIACGNNILLFLDYIIVCLKSVLLFFNASLAAGIVFMDKIVLFWRRIIVFNMLEIGFLCLKTGL